MLGLLTKEIAEKMNRSKDTVTVHFRNIYEKTHVQNEIELYNWYAENILNINIRKMLQVGLLILVLSPAVLNHNNEILRAARCARTTARASRRAENDTNNYLLN